MPKREKQTKEWNLPVGWKDYKEVCSPRLTRLIHVALHLPQVS
jgi:hypothetical protein